MKLLEFSYRNILSYGNVLQRFEFSDEPQLILVEGENGAGKSSIKEALTVSVYGRSAIRKMKDIPNWINRNAYTNVKFVTTSGDEIEINRGIDPNFSDIKINGTSFNLPDKRKVDEFIEDELVKIPFTAFCNTISLSFDDFKSFVNLSQGDKRKIVDPIFGIDVLADMRAVVKEDLRASKKSLDVLNAQIEKNAQTLERSVSQLDSLRDKLTKKKESESEELQQKIEAKETDLIEAKSKYTELKSKIEGLQTSVNSTKDDISSTKNTIKNLAEKLALYDKNRCPHCLNDLTSEASIKTKDLIATKKSTVEASLPDLTSALTSLQEQVTDLTSDQNTVKEEFYKVSAELDSLKSSLKKALAEPDSDETQAIEELISSIRDEISIDSNKASEKSQESDLFSVLDDLLSDSGIKKSLIDKIIPTLNGRIKEISTRLEFKFQFEFDSDFNPIISYLGMEISSDSLSSGQRKKMNLIVLLAFIEIIKMKHNQMNVLFLDEIFSSLDKNNVYMAIEILKEYSKLYNMTIFVVSHEALPEEFFDQRIFVKSVNHFSEMEIIKV